MKAENLKRAQSMLSRNLSIDAVAEAMSGFSENLKANGVCYWRQAILDEIERGNLVV